MKPEMKLASDAFLLDDITLPKFYSVQFKLSLNKHQDADERNQLILGFTDNLNQTDTAGHREPLFGVITKPSLVFVTKISSGNKNQKISKTDEWQLPWHDNWLSFKAFFLICS